MQLLNVIRYLGILKDKQMWRYISKNTLTTHKYTPIQQQIIIIVTWIYIAMKNYIRSVWPPDTRQWPPTSIKPSLDKLMILVNVSTSKVLYPRCYILVDDTAATMVLNDVKKPMGSTSTIPYYLGSGHESHNGKGAYTLKNYTVMVGSAATRHNVKNMYNAFCDYELATIWDRTRCNILDIECVAKCQVKKNIDLVWKNIVITVAPTQLC
jgi:hypothetical protein